MPLSATDRTFLGKPARKIDRDVERNLEGAQVAVIDADQSGAGIQGALQFWFIMHFDQRLHPQPFRFHAQAFQRGRVQERGNQQYGVRSRVTRLEDLIGIDDEILAQQRNFDVPAQTRQYFQIAVKVMHFRDNGERGRAGLPVFLARSSRDRNHPGSLPPRETLS